MDQIKIIVAPFAWISMLIEPKVHKKYGPYLKLHLWEPGGSLHSEIGTATQLDRAGVAQLRDVCEKWLAENGDLLRELDEKDSCAGTQCGRYGHSEACDER